MNYLRAGWNWWQVARPAIKWGTVSITAGMLTGPNPLSRHSMHRWCVESCNGLGIRRALHNGHRLAGMPQCVLIANHQSLLDIIVIGSYLQRDYRWVSKDAIFRVPFLGPHLKYSGHIPVYRGERASSENSRLPERIARVVEDEGADIMFFPEGTRTTDGRLQPFKIGAFMTAVLNDIPIVPLVVRGTGELMVKGARDLAIDHTRECSVTVLEPLYPRDAAEFDTTKGRASALRDRAWEIFAEELGELPDTEGADDEIDVPEARRERRPAKRAESVSA